MSDLTYVRKSILKKRGLRSARDSILRQKKLLPDSPPSGVHKTPLMMLLEHKFGGDIVDLVCIGSVREVARKMYPLVDHSTICKWRHQFAKELKIEDIHL